MVEDEVVRTEDGQWSRSGIVKEAVFESNTNCLYCTSLFIEYSWSFKIRMEAAKKSFLVESPTRSVPPPPLSG